ncbi:bifunctional 3-(3-hydroxy-phenyl)propionate/3-hydroxycinnamic acid hydroxylase MhpA [Nocardia shimofusensis]|uniref:bifunctional 3-(3-hydroxy-phenyl)propionate/3-hydroxycinnamic acid hydroxylase MhpA n=1 Tax=Nocardia shimofusensis TaxID=228596 RepID=UPI000830766C|nr:bifunctional 3-(3-hydroxy-phenyl)propionate/3-hydroxycinnamic acid hydroxylase [Nocardia shimofusensis]
MIISHHRVVVVGAGPTGLTAALSLARHGIDCLVLDRWDEVYPQPRAVHLDDEVYRIVAWVGLADEFARISRPSAGLRLVGRDGEVMAEFRRDAGESANGFPRANMFDQPEFERMLRAALPLYDEITFRGGVEVTDVVHTEAGVRVDYLDRAGGERAVAHADYVLGCDGANSVVRAAIGSRMQDLRFEQRWLVVDIATSADLGHWDGVHQVCDPDRAATYMRIGDTRYRWEFRLRAGESAADYGTLADLRPLLAPWTGEIDSSGLELIRVAEYTFRAQVADRWRDRRVFLLGDAAHLTPPFIGQGMGAGLRDAFNLTWKLAGVLDGALDPDRLETYEQERKPHARAMIRLAATLGRAMTEGGVLGELFRRRLVRLAGRVQGVGAKVADGVTPALRESDFVHRAAFRRGLAGTLCPNPAVDERGRRLDEVAPGRFLVVTTVRPTDGQRDEIERRGGVVIQAKAGSGLARWLREGHATAAIVRPDRMVLRAGRSLSSLHTWLPTML